MARVSLPGVPAAQQRVWLSDDARTVFVRAMRRVPAAGARCLPRSARLSADGAHEVFDVALPVPMSADASQARLRDVRGGLQIVLPLRAAPSRAVPSHSTQPDIDVQSPVSPTAVPPPSRSGTASATTTPTPVELTPEQRKLIEGVEIVEEDFPWPEKRADAVEGWWDNRGTFQYY